MDVHEATGGEDGRATSLNDHGEVALRIEFTDGSQGIFLADASQATTTTTGQPRSHLVELRPGQVVAQIDFGNAELMLASLPYHEDFENGEPEALQGLLGQWSVSGGEYHVTIGAGENSTSVVSFNEPLPDEIQVLATMRGRTAPGRFTNAVIIFDYEGPDDYKMVGAFFGSNTWRIGRMVDGQASYDVVLSDNLSTETDYDVTLSIRGRSVALLVNGDFLGSFDYGESLMDGPVGLGTLNASASFNDLAVQQLTGGLGAIQGIKWHDLDADGLYEPGDGEPGLAGWTIYLDLNRNGTADDNEPSQVTDVNGAYAFNDLEPAGYKVTEMIQPGWFQTFPKGDGSHDAALSSDETQVLNFANAQPLATLPYADDFEDGFADSFLPSAGAWQVVGGRYESTSDLNDNGLSLLQTPAPLPAEMEIDVTISAPLAADGRFSNALIVLDYHGPDNLNYVGAFTQAGKFRFGRFRNGTFTNDLIVAGPGLAPGVSTSLRLSVDRATVSLVANGEFVATHRFGDPLHDGQFGLGTRNAVAHFDDLQIRETGAELPFAEDFEDGLAEDFVVLAGAWQTADGRYHTAPVNGGTSISIVDIRAPLPDAFEFNVTVNSPAGNTGLFSNALMIFDYQGPNDFR